MPTGMSLPSFASARSRGYRDNSLPHHSEVVAFARRLEKAGAAKDVPANKSALIDALAQFPDATAAEAIALESDSLCIDKTNMRMRFLRPIR